LAFIEMSGGDPTTPAAGFPDWVARFSQSVPMIDAASSRNGVTFTLQVIEGHNVEIHRTSAAGPGSGGMMGLASSTPTRILSRTATQNPQGLVV